jgi:hypothetical protein
MIAAPPHRTNQGNGRVKFYSKKDLTPLCLSVGGGVDFSINPPSPCEKYVSPYLGLGKNLSIGTNVSVISKGKEPLKLKVQGFNLSLGPSLGIPIGALIPDAFSNKQR